MAVKIVATVAARVRPDFDGFEAELRAKLQEFEQRNQLHLKADLDLETKGAEQHLKEFQESASQDDLNLDVDVDTEGATEHLDEFSAAHERNDIHYNVDADTERARAALAALSAETRGNDDLIEFDVDSKSLASVRAAIASVDKQVAKRREVRIHVNPDETSIALAKAELEDLERSLTSKNATIDFQVDRSSITSVRAQIAALDKELSRRRVETVTVRADTASLQAELKQAQAAVDQMTRHRKLQIDVDDTSLASLKSELAAIDSELSRRRSKTVDLDLDTGELEAKLSEVESEVDALTRHRALQLGVDPSSVASLKGELAAIDKELSRRRQIDVDLDLDTADLERMRAEVDSAVRDRTMNIDVDVDSGASLKAALAKIDAEISRRRAVKINLNVDDAELAEVRARLDEVARNRHVDVNADVDTDTKGASAKMDAWRKLQSSKSVNQNIFLNDGGLFGTYGRRIAILSGLVALIIPQTAALASELWAVGVAAAAITPAGIMAVAAGIGVVTAAWKGLGASAAPAAKEMNSSIADLKKTFTGFQKTLQQNYFSEFADSFRDAVKGMAKQAQEGLGEIATAAGKMTDAVVVGFSKGMGANGMTVLLGNIAKGFTALSPGIERTVQGLTELGVSGSKYLVLIEQHLGNIGVRFGNWLSQVSDDKVLSRVWSNAAAAMEDFSSIVSSSLSIIKSTFAGLASSGDGLQPLVDLMKSLADMMGGTMQPILSSFSSAMNAVFEAVGPVVDAFMEMLSPALVEAFNLFTDLTDVVRVRLPQAMKGATSGFSDFGQSLNQMRPYFEDIARRLTDAFGSLAKLFGSVLGAAVRALIPLLAKLLDAVVPLIKKFTDWFTDLPAQTQESIVKFVVFGAMAGAVLKSIAGFFAPVIGGLVGLVTKAGGVGPAFEGIAGTLSKILPAVGIIGGIAGAFVGVVAASKDFRNALLDGLKDVWNGFKDFAAGVAAVLQPVGDLLGSVFKDFGDTTAPLLKMVLQGVGDAFSYLGSTLKIVGAVLKPLLAIIGGLIKVALIPLKAAIEKITGTKLGDWIQDGAKNFSKFADAVSDVASKVTPIITDIMNVVVDMVTAVFDLLTGDWKGAWKAMGSVVDDAKKTVSDTGKAIPKELVTNLVHGLEDRIGDVQAWFAKLPENIISWVKSLPQSMLKIGSDTIGGFFDGLDPAWEKVTSWFGEVPAKIQTAFGDLLGVGKTKAGDLWGGFLGGLAEAWNTVVAWFASLPTNIGAAFGDLFGTGSAKAGELWSGFTAGLVTAWETVVTWFQSLPQMISDGIGDLFAGGTTKGGDIIGGILDGATTIFSSLLAPWLGGLPGLVLSNVGDFLGTLWQKGSDLITGFFKGVQAIWTTVVGWLQGLPGNAGSAVGYMGGVLLSAGGLLIQGFKNGIDSIWPSVSSFLGGIPGKVVSAVGNVGSLLENAGSSIMGGFLRGLRSMWGNIQSFVGDIAGWIAAHKGPLSYDARLLIPHGKAIMSSLKEGLQVGFKPVATYVSGVAPALQALVSGGFEGTAAGPTLGGNSGNWTGDVNIYPQQGDGYVLAKTIGPAVASGAVWRGL